MTILDEIKHQTKSSHQQVEKVLIHELKNLRNKDDYGKLLERLFLFYKPIEVILHNTIDDSMIPDISKRKHTHHILRDLELLDYQMENTPQKSSLNITTPSYAFGVLYVIEGSTMGGQIISKMLHSKIEMGGLDATNYFSSYREDNHAMWTAFRNHILELEKALNPNEMLRGAKDTFEKLEDFLKCTTFLESTNV